MFNHKLHNQPPTRKQAGRVAPGSWLLVGGTNLRGGCGGTFARGQMARSGVDTSCRKPARAVCRQQVWG